MKKNWKRMLWVGSMWAVWAAPVSWAQAPMVSTHTAALAQASEKTHRVVVTYRSNTDAQLYSAMGDTPGRLKSARVLRQMGPRTAIFDIGKNIPIAEARAFAKTLLADPEIVSAEPDLLVQATQTLSAADLKSQWALIGDKAGSIFPGSPHLDGSGVFIAILDTGMVQHSALNPSANPWVAGWDFISDIDKAADGDKRDSDPTDPGDTCNGSPSTWHGTKVAGVLKSIVPNAQILNARVLGKCGGWLSDVSDAIRWSAGLAVDGVTPHGKGSGVIMNLSLGLNTYERCPSFLQDAIDQAYRAGAVVVAAAGNGGMDNNITAPANCNRVISVAAHNAAGDLAYYSNVSPEVTVSAPGGGECKRMSNSTCIGSSLLVTSTTNTPNHGFTDQFNGTSAATPFVTATVAQLQQLARSKNSAAEPALSWYSTMLIATAANFAEGTRCVADCFFGLLRNAKALNTADVMPMVGIAAEQKKVVAAKSAVINLIASIEPANQASDYDYSWKQVSGISASDLKPNGSALQFMAPATSGTLVFEANASSKLWPAAPYAPNTIKTYMVVEVGSNTPPVLAPIATQVAVAGQPWTFNTTVTDGENNFSRLLLYSAPVGMGTTGATLNWQSPVAGNYYVQIAAEDASNATSPTVSFQLQVSSGGGSGGGNWGLLGGAMLAMALGLAIYAQRQQTR